MEVHGLVHEDKHHVHVGVAAGADGSLAAVGGEDVAKLHWLVFRSVTEMNSWGAPRVVNTEHQHFPTRQSRANRSWDRSSLKGVRIAFYL